MGKPVPSKAEKTGGVGWACRRKMVQRPWLGTRLLRHQDRAYMLSSLSSTATTIFFSPTSLQSAILVQNLFRQKELISNCLSKLPWVELNWAEHKSLLFIYTCFSSWFCSTHSICSQFWGRNPAMRSVLYVLCAKKGFEFWPNNTGQLYFGNILCKPKKLYFVNIKSFKWISYI